VRNPGQKLALPSELPLDLLSHRIYGSCDGTKLAPMVMPTELNPRIEITFADVAND
jgi:hypothetical protein